MRRPTPEQIATARALLDNLANDYIEPAEEMLYVMRRNSETDRWTVYAVVDNVNHVVLDEVSRTIAIRTRRALINAYVRGLNEGFSQAAQNARTSA